MSLFSRFVLEAIALSFRIVFISGMKLVSRVRCPRLISVLASSGVVTRDLALRAVGSRTYLAIVLV